MKQKKKRSSKCDDTGIYKDGAWAVSCDCIEKEVSKSE